MPTKQYERKKERAARVSAEQSRSGRDIAPIPPIANIKRRMEATRSLRRFCEIYHPDVFCHPWSDDHLEVLATMQSVIEQGGQFPLAMPRGSGKTSICEAACEWAAITGRRRFIVLIAATDDLATASLNAIRTTFETNDLLAEDFPEVLYPIRCMDGITQRAKGQLLNGRRTRIEWTDDGLILPTVPGSAASGTVFKVRGLLSATRGLKHNTPSGEALRPDLAIIDDPQTDKSARSLVDCQARESIINSSILYLAGPGKKLAICMPCTVIKPDDVADNFLNPDRHPEWTGKRYKLVLTFPNDEAIWQRYAEIRAEGLKAGDKGKAGNAFYRKHRTRMDAGAKVAWEYRFNDDEISAIQHAMNLKLRDEAAFWSEVQNEPLREGAGDTEMVTARALAEHTSHLPAGEIPAWATRLTMFVDVQARLLYWTVAAWSDSFEGHVVEYGTYPDQGTLYFNYRKARRTLRSAAGKNAGLQSSILAGLAAIVEAKLEHTYRTEGGATLSIERCLVDSGWKAPTVYEFVRATKHRGAVMPSKGIGITAGNMPMAEWRKKPGDRLGHDWRIRADPAARDGLRLVMYDVNTWKTFLHEHLSIAQGDPGALTLHAGTPTRHRLFAEHLTAETPVRTEGRGRTVIEWKLPPAKPDNHYLDCLVGCAVAASVGGSREPGHITTPEPRKRRPRQQRVSALQT